MLEYLMWQASQRLSVDQQSPGKEVVLNVLRTPIGLWVGGRSYPTFIWLGQVLPASRPRAISRPNRRDGIVQPTVVVMNKSCKH